MDERDNTKLGRAHRLLLALILSAILAFIAVLFKIGWSHYWRLALGAQLFALKIVLLVVVPLAAILFCTIMVARLLRPSDAAVFVSYPHELEDLASLLTRGLSACK